MKYLSIYGIAIWAMFSSFKSDDLIQKRFSDTPTIAANQWSLGLNYGIAGSIRESTKIESLQSPGVRMNVKYMVQPNMGIIALAGYNALSTSTLVGNKSQYAYATLELAYLLSSLNNNVGVLFHTGPGVGSMWNKDVKYKYPGDPFFKNQDDVINLNFGIAPQIAIAKNVLFNIDFSYAWNFLQDHNFDYTDRPRGTAMMYNLSAGLVFKLNQSNQMVHMLINPTLVLKDSIREILPEQSDSLEVMSVDTAAEPLEFKSPDVVEVMGADTAEDNSQVKISDSVEVIDEETEIPAKGVKGTKVQYRIQFTMSKTQIPVKTFTDKGMGSIYEYQHDGHYKYCTDKVFSSRAKALNELSLVRGMGYSDAFIAVFQNGVRVK